MPLYPREHLLPNGKVFESGANRNSQIYDPAAHTFTTVATTIFDRNRDYGTSVLLPLTPANGFKPKVMILGGAIPATDTTELIDLSVADARLGGRTGDGQGADPDQRDPAARRQGPGLRRLGERTRTTPPPSARPSSTIRRRNAFASASSMEFPRLYHSNTLLLPDATVVALGGNPERKVYQPEIEIYSPPYLFNRRRQRRRAADDRQRPGGTIHYGARAPGAHAGRGKTSSSVVLIRAGAVTHAFDMDQRLVGLTFTAGAGVLNAKAPANGNLAPPGLLPALHPQRPGRAVRGAVRAARVGAYVPARSAKSAA